MEGDLYVVGADEDSQRGPSAGAVLIGTRIDGAWVSERVAPDSLEDASRFGASVAISDGVIAVGARNDPRWGERAGQVWILERRFGAWTVTEQVAPPEPEPLGRFGSAVAFDGETLVVSSNSADVEQGKVHIFRRDSDAGFVHVVTHLSGRDSDTSLFGTAIALEGDTLAVGDIESESVWLFCAPFTEDPVRIGSETSSGFGSALDINEDWLLVGASSGPTGGSALAYRRTETGVAETPIEITVDGLDSGARFGAAVALDGDTALIGAFRAAVAADRAGTASRSDAGFEELGVLTPDTSQRATASASRSLRQRRRDRNEHRRRWPRGHVRRIVPLCVLSVRSSRRSEYCGTVTTDDHFGGAVATAGGTILSASRRRRRRRRRWRRLVFRAFEGSYRYVQRLERQTRKRARARRVARAR